jgi:hypothetical protein
LPSVFEKHGFRKVGGTLGIQERDEEARRALGWGYEEFRGV